MDNFMKLFLWIVATTTLLGWAGSTYAEYGINFPEPVTGNARDIYNIHMNTVAIITVMMVIVYSIVAFSIYFHRKSRGYNADQNFHKSWFGRWAWVLVPIIVLGVDLSIAGNAERVLKQLWLIPKDENMMEVKVIGHQWW